MENQKIEELLAILDLPEDEQAIFLKNHFTKLYFNSDEWPYWYGVCHILHSGTPSEQRDILAIIAFQLRDELHNPIGAMSWDIACWEVWKYEKKRQDSNILERKHLSRETLERYCHQWTSFWAEPIHWIIIALIAKLLAKED